MPTERSVVEELAQEFERQDAVRSACGALDDLLDALHPKIEEQARQQVREELEKLLADEAIPQRSNYRDGRVSAIDACLTILDRLDHKGETDAQSNDPR